MTYKIIRFFSDSQIPSQLIYEGLTLEEAQEHCNNPKTRKDGEWFDGYTEE